MPFMMRSLIPPGHPTTGVGPFNRRLECHYRDGLLGAVRSPPLARKRFGRGGALPAGGLRA